MTNPQLLQPFEVTGVRAVGYLDKARDGAVRSGWTTRFFVLTKTHLSYFKRNDPVQELTGEHRRTIALNEIHVVTTTQGEPGFTNIEVQTAKQPSSCGPSMHSSQLVGQCDQVGHQR